MSLSKLNYIRVFFLVMFCFDPQVPRLQPRKCETSAQSRSRFPDTTFSKLSDLASRLRRKEVDEACGKTSEGNST